METNPLTGRDNGEGITRVNQLFKMDRILQPFITHWRKTYSLGCGKGAMHTGGTSSSLRMSPCSPSQSLVKGPIF